MSVAQANSVDIDKWLCLIRADNVGATTFAKLIKHFGSADRALGASVSELAKVNGIGCNLFGLLITNPVHFGQLTNRSTQRVVSRAEMFYQLCECSRTNVVGPD